MAVLYSKYRPKIFAEVVGQEAVVTALKNSVIKQSFAHAYLFTGGRGVGKTSVARILARAVNCQNLLNGEPCLQCQVCEAIRLNNFLDLQEIDAASHTGVDNIRELIENSTFRPAMGKFKVYIIDEVHMLSKGAFNALLKTLEEPPEHVVFILATTEIHKVPNTIISRTQRYDFGLLSKETMKTLLVKVVDAEMRKVDSRVLDLTAAKSQGSVRDALSILEKVLIFNDPVAYDEVRNVIGTADVEWVIKVLELIAENNLSVVAEFCAQIQREGVDIEQLLIEILNTLRQEMLLKFSAGSEHSHLNLIRQFTVLELVTLTKLFLKAYKDLKDSPDEEIPLILAIAESVEFLHKNSKIIASAQVLSNKIQAQSEISEKLSKFTVHTNTLEKILDNKHSTEGVVLNNNHVDESKLKLIWPSVIEQVKAKNGPLGMLLKNSPLAGIEDNKAVIEVKYLFHKEQVESSRNWQLICDIIKLNYGEPVAFTTRIVKGEDVAGGTANTLDALQVFGGEIIE